MPIRLEKFVGIATPDKLNEEGQLFLANHHLVVIPSSVFTPPFEKPWIDATTEIVQIKDEKFSTMRRGLVTVDNILNALAEYENRTIRRHSSITSHLDDHEPMEVKWGNMEWYPVLKKLESMFPGAVLWPQ